MPNDEPSRLAADAAGTDSRASRMPPSPPGHADRDRRLVAILAMLAAVGAFAVMDAGLKHLSGAYPPLQVACMRGLASIPFFLGGIALAGQWQGIIPVRWAGHLIRGGLAIVMLWTFIYAVSKLPLGTAYGIVLCAPLLITALSAVVLREHVGPHRWAAIVCGLAGVFVILNPNGRDMVTIAGLAAFVAALCYAVAALMIRKLALTDTTLSIGLSFMVIVAAGTGLLALPDWVPVDGAHWPWILLVGVSGALAQYLMIHAFRSAPASVIAPFEYTALLWAMGLDWLIWSTIPSARMLTGASIVIASGLYLIYREHWAHRAIPKPLPDSGI
jgi:drug/metabolite transporter (DMT)-like permease